MKSLLLCAVLLTAAPAFSQTTVPATPTLHANPDFKGLQFDWAPAAGASWYQLEYRAHQTGSFSQQGDDFPATATHARFSFPLHLFDWTYARYRLATSNRNNNTNTTTNTETAQRHKTNNNIKASQPKEIAFLGREVA